MWFLHSFFEFEPYASEQIELGCENAKTMGLKGNASDVSLI